MSMHFAPQWVKPIKPTGSSAMTPNSTEIQPSALNPHPVKQTQAQPQVPFPALTPSNQPPPLSATTGGGMGHMSYSRATHTPASPSFPTDGSYFPTDDNGASLNPHPFRYSREQILGLYDDEKFKSTPIELVELLEQGSVLVSPHINRPIAMRELTDAEKKIFSTSVHPVVQPRRTQQAPATPGAEQGNNTPARRAGQAGVTRDPTQPNGRGFGNFGRGDGGILSAGGIKSGVIGGGAVASPAGDGKAPGVLGGGFGGVGKRLARGRNENSDSPSGPWRSFRTASGNFEGVLGFGGNQNNAPSQPPVNEADESMSSADVPQTAPIVGGWRDRLAAKQAQKKENEETAQPATAASAGWGSTQSKWRAPSGTSVQSSIDAPHQNGLSASVIATPSATPVPDRDATVETADEAENKEEPVQQQQQPQPTEEDLNAAKWFYRDPQGQEQGPYLGSQMHDWFSHSYFTDDLPVKRESEPGFHTLAQLKEATGNLVQPFISAIRPRQPPPNLPMPNMLPPHLMPIGDSFRNLAIHPGYPSDPRMAPGQPGAMPPFAPPFRNDAPFSPGHYGPQQGFLPNPLQSPGYLGNPGQTWGGMQPGGNRFNAGFGAPVGPGIGQLPGPFPQQGAFSPAIGGPIGRVPDFFSPSIGAGAPGSIPTSPWAQQQQPQLHQMYPPQQQQQQQQDQYQQQQPMDQQWQQQQQQQQQQPQQQSEASGQQPQPSYFPQVEEEQTPAQPPSEHKFELEPALEDAPEEKAEPEVPAEEASESADTIEEPVPAPTAPPASAWGAVPASRRSSLANEQTPSTPATSKPSAPPSTKAASSRKPSIAEAPVLAPAVATPERSSNTPKPAPWAPKDDKEVKTPSGPSLREIQEAEAKVAEARNKAIAELRANNAVPSPAPSSNEDIITSMSWGLPTQNSKAPQVSSPSVNSPSAPAWGAGDSAGPKKTMKQIQEEEEKRKAKLAQAKAQAQAQATSSNPGAAPSANTKRGYADLAATSTPSSGSGWQTVGAKAVPGSAAPTPAARPAAPVKPAVVAPSKPAAPNPAIRTVKANGGSSDDSTPSVEFVRWAKQSLNGLNVNIDEFIQMLLSFPIDPPQSERAGQLEIISDSVYANSSTLDGRRFAQEFYTRRKADSKRSAPVANGSTPSKPTSLADVLKAQPKPQSADLGFKIVKAKGKKKN